MRGRPILIAAGCAAVLGGMLLIPGERQNAVADTPAVTSVTSHETIAAIDAMLSPPVLPTLPERIRPKLTTAPEPEPDNFQTASISSPATETPAIDPNLTPDAIGSSAVKLRAGPSSSTSTITVLQPGQAIHTGKADGGWVEVTLPDGTTGWVFSRYLASVAAAAPPEPKPDKPVKAKENTKTAKAVIQGKGNGRLEGRTARIGASFVARSIPSSSARKVFTTQPGERVKIVESRGKWIRIVTSDGSSGWIQTG